MPMQAASGPWACDKANELSFFLTKNMETKNAGHFQADMIFSPQAPSVVLFVVKKEFDGRCLKSSLFYYAAITSVVLDTMIVADSNDCVTVCTF